MSKRLSNGLKLLLGIGFSAFLVSCETVGYYSQAARGQLAILLGREQIERLLEDPDLSPVLRDKFVTLLLIREFAEQELSLPVGKNYLTYVDLGRERVVWNVFAAPELAIDPINWCYPIAGCVSYRGYFSEDAANNFARQLAAQGYDVYTGGVDAYSTLGWFNDSLLSTVIARADYQLAALIFHELAHQIVYVPGDTTFNESFATAVEREGLKRWLIANDKSDSLALAQADRERQAQFVELVSRHRDRLGTLYQQELSEGNKRERKGQIQKQLRSDYLELKQQWDGYGGYDSWFASSLNNAQLSTVASYNDLVPFFVELLEREDLNLNQFYQRVKELAELDESERQARTVSFAVAP